MPQRWSAPRPHVFRDAYIDWSRLVGLRRDMLAPEVLDHADEIEPIFVRLVPGKDAVLQREHLLALVTDPEQPLLMDGFERKTLEDRCSGTGPLDGLPDEYMLYRLVGTPDNAHAQLFDVLDTGVPVRIAPGNTVTGTDRAEDISGSSGQPIVAILDDGIGFLNARFCRAAVDTSDLTTRFRAVWLQALEQRDPEAHGTIAGKVLYPSDINDLMRANDETASYAKVNASLFSRETRHETGFSTTHGTHVLDLAAGADPCDATDPAREWPLLAVQLPPETIDDTSGTWFESYLLQGLRWILHQARRIDPKAPVIVNVSLGVLAGSKDGTRFLEDQVAREVRNWEAVTQQPVRLVWAFGNSHRSSQVAKVSLPATEPDAVPIAWRVQPDDETSSFVEVHGRGVDMANTAIRVTAPDGASSEFVSLNQSEIISLERDDGAALTRIYHVPERIRDERTRCASHLVIALAPTRGQKPGEPEAMPGAWHIEVSGDQAGDVLFQVQRDDAIRGSLMRGRQSYFDHPDAYSWDDETAAYTRPADCGPITDDGCHSAFVTALAPQIYCVGAARSASGTEDQSGKDMRPSGYSGKGASWSIDGPSVSALTGLGAFYDGLRAAGTMTGSTRRLTGTSAAAGRLTRALALSAPNLKPVATAEMPAASGNMLEDIDQGVVALYPTAADAPTDRLGAAIINPPDRLPPL